MSINPRVSVVIPTYNRAEQTTRALESVWNQTFSDYEIVVVDDGSTDNTAEVLQQFEPRIRLIRQPNGGVSKARNHGVSASNGELIAFLDSDDEWLPNKLQQQVEFLDAHRSIGFVACLNTYDVEHGFTYENSFSRDGLPSVVTQFLDFLLAPFPRNMSRYVMRREALVKCGGFDESIRGAEDWELCLRLLQSGFAFDFLDEALVVYQPGEDSLSADPEIMIQGEQLIKSRYLSQLQPRWKRWWYGSKFSAQAYFSAALGFRERRSTSRSVACLLKSLFANPLAPRTNRRLLTLLSLCWSDGRNALTR
ncbi:MAG: glycosyltransferase family A protein [Planctomycetota bacterium]|nr:glycosyltransferase family A protein [Planctomycetota bacterium]